MTPPQISISDLLTKADDTPRTLEELCGIPESRTRTFVKQIDDLMRTFKEVDEAMEVWRKDRYRTAYTKMTESRTPTPEP